MFGLICMSTSIILSQPCLPDGITFNIVKIGEYLQIENTDSLANLSVSDEESIKGIVIHDHLGREVLRVDGYQEKFNVSHYPRGMCTITLMTNSSHVVRKLLVY